MKSDGKCVCLQMMSHNLRGEMRSDFAGAKLCLSDSRFIQVIAKSLSISCKEVRGKHKYFLFTVFLIYFPGKCQSIVVLNQCFSVCFTFILAPLAFADVLLFCPQDLEAIRDALTPALACAAAKIGDIEALEALKEMVEKTWIYSNKRFNNTLSILTAMHIWFPPHF